MQLDDVAFRLITGAVRLTRRLRGEDAGARLTGPQASALAVVVHAGAIRLSDLAALEEVGRPAISKTVAQLEAAGLLRRTPDSTDGRATLLSATLEGLQLFEDGHRRRVAPLATALAGLSTSDQHVLARAAELLDALASTPLSPRAIVPPCPPP